MTLRRSRSGSAGSPSRGGRPVEERTYYGHDATVAVRLVGEHGATGPRVIVRTTGELPTADEVRLHVTGKGRFFPAETTT